MSVSLEAIFLSIFVLVSQNRQAAKDRITAQNDYDVNKLGEIEIQAVLLHLEEQDRLMFDLLERFDHTFSTPKEAGFEGGSPDPFASETALEFESNALIPGKKLDTAHRHKIEEDMWTFVHSTLNKAMLDTTEVRDMMGHCYAILNIEAFQRNSLIDPNFALDEGKVSVLRILYKESYISVGADYNNPDYEDLSQVRELLLQRAKHRGLDTDLVNKFAEITKTLVCKVPDAECS
jgi:hypothetical protein